MALTGKGLADYAISKKGTPYFYGAKMQLLTEAFMAQMNKSYPSVVSSSYIAKARTRGQVGKTNTDCSGLISAYTGEVLGSAQLYSQAYARLPISSWKDWAVGVVVWRSGHVGVYIGNGKVVEAKGIDYGTVESDITKGTWKYGLTFSWMEYVYDNVVVTTYRKNNPYTEPKANLKKGATGNGVKWLQWELNEAGFELEIDGDFGKLTLAAVKAFQKSAKLVVDGIVGKLTRAALKG